MTEKKPKNSILASGLIVTGGLPIPFLKAVASVIAKSDSETRERKNKNDSPDIADSSADPARKKEKPR